MIVHYYGGSAEAAGTAEETVDAGESTGLAALTEKLVGLHPGLEATMRVCSFFVDGAQARDDPTLRADARVDVLPPFAGG